MIIRKLGYPAGVRQIKYQLDEFEWLRAWDDLLVGADPAPLAKLLRTGEPPPKMTCRLLATLLDPPGSAPDSCRGEKVATFNPFGHFGLKLVLKPPKNISDARQMRAIINAEFERVCTERKAAGEKEPSEFAARYLAKIFSVTTRTVYNWRASYKEIKDWYDNLF